MTDNRQNNLASGSIDWWSVLIYAVLVLLGWVNLYAAVYDAAHSSIFDVSQRYGMQMIWIGISAFVGITIMLVDSKYYHILAYPFYWMGILVLLLVLLVGREVNGAKAWIYIGNIALQPAEFVKFTTSLALARYMSRFNFSINKLGDLFRVGVIMFLPALIIVLHNDTGSAVVYGGFLMVLYREGLNSWVYVAVITAILLFIFSFLLAPATILILLVIACVIGEGLVNGRWKQKVMYLSGISLCTLVLYFGLNFLSESHVSFYICLLISSLGSIVFAGLYAYRNKLRNVFMFVALFVGSVAFTSTVDYVFDNVMQVHQQKRVLDLLGLETDTQNWGYNVNQSKIAIGSGGFLGKGFLEGTQTRFDFVPEQSTDFIFCTVGEEWGFVGSSIVVILFGLLILRLMKMGERQREPFGRIYCYCVAAVFFVHVIVNIGMTIGIMPVIGIPLPFFSYGGSSFLAFTLLFFVAVKLDSDKRELMRH